MPPGGPVVRGALAGHPLAPPFAAEVARLQRRYATEVVGAFGLCPFFKDAESSLGRLLVFVDPDPTEELVRDAVLEEESTVAHLVFPLVTSAPAEFERYAGRLLTAIGAGRPDKPVHATFHPRLAGSTGNQYAVVGLLRRSPDPFVQLVPAGLTSGGTKLADPDDPPTQNHATTSFRRLTEGDGLTRLIALTVELQAERERVYAPFLEALAL